MLTKDRLASRTGALALAATFLGCALPEAYKAESSGSAGASGSSASGMGATSGGGGGAGGTGTTGSGGAGGTTLCPGPAVPGELIANGSFEYGGSSWTAFGQAGSLATVAADDCALACGDLVGELSGDTAGLPDSTISIHQSFAAQLELGGALSLSARYAFTASSDPYFTVTSNGYDIGQAFIYGDPMQGHRALEDRLIAIDDPRRTGNDAALWFVQNLGPDRTSSALVDCISLTYAPPDGTKLLSNGWFDSGLSGWTAADGALPATQASGGNCTPNAARVTVPTNTTNAELRADVPGAWPAGTTFHLGGAWKPLPDGLSSLSFVLHLHVEYDPSGGEDIVATAVDDSEAWSFATTSFTAPNPVKLIGARLAATNATGGDLDFLADCFSLRAAP